MHLPSGTGVQPLPDLHPSPFPVCVRPVLACRISFITFRASRRLRAAFFLLLLVLLLFSRRLRRLTIVSLLRRGVSSLGLAQRCRLLVLLPLLLVAAAAWLLFEAAVLLLRLAAVFFLLLLSVFVASLPLLLLPVASLPLLLLPVASLPLLPVGVFGVPLLLVGATGLPASFSSRLFPVRFLLTLLSRLRALPVCLYRPSRCRCGVAAGVFDSLRGGSTDDVVRCLSVKLLLL